jgi:hypothetical protein
MFRHSSLWLRLFGIREGGVPRDNLCPLGYLCFVRLGALLQWFH